MTEATERVITRRILVALRDGRHERGSLEAAARLAGRMEAELLGLFIEDVNLMRLAGLPFAREVERLSARARVLSPGDMERTLRSVGAELQRTLMQVAEQAGVPWSFRAVRGRIAEQLLSAGADVDLMVLGYRARYAGTAGEPLLQPAGALAVTYDGTPAGERALRVAAELARDEGRDLVVFAVGTNAETAGPAAGSVIADTGLMASGRRWRWRRLADTGSETLAAAVRASASAGLVVSLDDYANGPRRLERLMGELRCPLIVVR